MKRVILGIFVLAAMYSCGNNASNAKQESAPTTPATTATESKPEATSENGTHEKALDLIAKSDCLTCHKVDEKVIGPAYREVANKYENTDANVTLLAEKIIKGGQGVWGEVPMTPHPQVTEADAKEMVKYVLSLRNK